MTTPALRYFSPTDVKKSDKALTCDICVYGGTAGGVVAAVAAARRGKSVVLLQPGGHLGGMTSGGLGETDFGKKNVIGGMSRQFYADLGKHYGRAEEWKFEPSAATKVLTGYLAGTNVQIHLHQFIERAEVNADNRIVSINMLGGLKVTAKVFIDATYEGDLMAQAGVSFHVGREANSVYGETINGVQERDKHQFSDFVDPFIKPGDPSSGTLPYVNLRTAAKQGSGDARVQAYNFRVCMTDDPELKIPWAKPENFDALQYEIVRRWFNSTKDEYNEQVYADKPDAPPRKFDVLTQRTKNGFRKTDTNNHGPVSSDFIGANYAWAESDYQAREKMFQAHVSYQQGLYWFLANDPSIPARYRDAYSVWGLPKDEFTETGNWPHQLYVREARRMVSDYVLNELDTQHKRTTADPVGMGSYQMDSHNCQRFVAIGKDGRPCVRNEGDVQLSPAGPYPISYRSIVPKRSECTNLFVPVCLSASHIAYGSVRMEPVFMVTGESSAIAACMAIDAGVDVQAVDYKKLRAELDKAQQVVTIEQTR